MPYNKICKFLGYPKMFQFFGYQLDGEPCWFVILLDKVYADAINDLQYHIGTMHVNACKVCKFYLFLREIWVQTQIINKNCTINVPKRSIFKTLSLICTRYLLFWFIHSACLGSSPELWFLSSPEKTWYPWLHTVSY